MKKSNKIKKFRYMSYFMAIAIILGIGTYSMIDALTLNTALETMSNNSEVFIQAGASIMAEETVSGNVAAIGGGIAAIGMIGAGIGQGYAAGKAAEAVGRNPEAESQIRNTMIIGSAIAETGALYALVIAVLAIFIA